MIIGVTVNCIGERKDKFRGTIGVHHELLILQRIQVTAIWPAPVSDAERSRGHRRVEIIFPFRRLPSDAHKVPLTVSATLAKSQGIRAPRQPRSSNAGDLSPPRDIFQRGYKNMVKRIAKADGPRNV